MKTTDDDLPDTLPPPPAELFAEALIEVADALDAIEAKVGETEAKVGERHLEALRAIAKVNASVEEGYDRRVNISDALEKILEGMGEIRALLDSRDRDDEEYRKTTNQRLRDLEAARREAGNGAAHQ